MRNDLISPSPSPKAAHSAAGLLPPLVAGSVLSISTFTLLVMLSHSSARAAAAAQPTMAASTSAARIGWIVIMVSPRPGGRHTTGRAPACHDAGVTGA